MKKALVEPTGRIAQVEPVNQAEGSKGIPFPVAAPLQWVDCGDDVTPGTHVFEGGQVVRILQPVVHPNVAIKAQLDALDAISRTTRGQRELALSFAQLAELLRATTHPQIPSTADNGGMIKAAEIEAQAAALRAQLDPAGP